jgi:hypothetical protein
LGSNITGSINGTVQEEIRLVIGLYQSVLGRNPEVAGLIGGVQFLESGATRADLANRLWQSAEHRLDQVNQYYATFLHRAPDIGGQTAWVGAFLSGLSETDVMSGILGSTEYQASHGSNAAFVNGLYSDVLGRSPDASGQAAWLQMLGSGATRQAVAQRLLSSGEAYLQAIDDYYANFLGRTRDQAGEQFNLTQLQSGRASLESRAVAFLASNEFFARVNS